MDQIPIPIRFILVFKALRDGEIIDLEYQVNAPAEAHIPLPGDEVLLPEEKSTAKGFTSKVFTVAKRRFLYSGVTGVAGAATLLLSQDK
jgi:hypothetical protein